MPWHISKRDGKYCVIKNGTDEVEGCHTSRGDAADQIRALYANEADMEEIYTESPLNSENVSPPVELAAPIPAEHIREMEAIAKELRVLADKLEVYHNQKPMNEPVNPPVQDNMPSQTDYVSWAGPITYEGIFTGDRRFFNSGAVTWNADLLPIPFKWQRISADGHDSSVTIGRVDTIYRKNDEIWGEGVILLGNDAPPEGKEYLALLENDAAGGVSIDGDNAEFEIQIDEKTQESSLIFSQINIRALTAVDIPAFAGAKIKLKSDLGVLNQENEIKKRKNQQNRPFYNENEPLIASIIPIDPPKSWFDDPEFNELTPITITDEGQIYGHLASLSCYIGYGSCVTPPRNCDYDNYFHLGALRTLEGEEVAVGHMTFGGGHSDLNLSASEALARYDSTSRVCADIRAGEDEFGTWIVGAMRPGLTPEDLREIRSAPLSGDWRPISGKHQLIAAHAVNVPGFVIPRVKALVASGETQGLIITESQANCMCDGLSVEQQEFEHLMFELDLQDIELATKTEDGKQFEAGDYAYVPDPDMPSTWKLRLTDTPGGAPDSRHVGAAIAALGKGFRGHKVQIPEADLPGVKRKVLAAWKKLNPDAKPADYPKVLTS